MSVMYCDTGNHYVDTDYDEYDYDLDMCQDCADAQECDNLDGIDMSDGINAPGVPRWYCRLPLCG